MGTQSPKMGSRGTDQGLGIKRRKTDQETALGPETGKKTVPGPETGKKTALGRETGRKTAPGLVINTTRSSIRGQGPGLETGALTTAMSSRSTRTPGNMEVAGDLEAVPEFK